MPPWLGTYLSTLETGNPNLVYIGSFLFGAFAMPLYSLSAAHANDNAMPGQFVIVSAGILFFFALGSTLGPLIASFVIAHFGAPAFFAYTGIVHAGLIATALIRIAKRPQLPLPSSTRFVAFLRTSPMAFRLGKRRSNPAMATSQIEDE